MCDTTVKNVDESFQIASGSQRLPGLGGSPGLPGSPGLAGSPGIPGFGRGFELPILYSRVESAADVSSILEFEDEVEEDEGEYQDKTDVYLRSKFFESWLWVDVKLPKQTDSDG